MNRRPLLINILFLSAAGLLVLWLVKIWMVTSEPTEPELDSKGPAPLREERPTLPSSSYERVVSANLFNSSRRDSQAVAAVRNTRPSTPPPDLVLLGTVLIGDKKTAIIGSKKPSQKPESYKVGDDVEGFVLREVLKNKVVLERGREVIEVVMIEYGQESAGRTMGVSRPSRNAPSGRVMLRGIAPPPPPPPRPVHGR